jgi:hypothetical protein
MTRSINAADKRAAQAALTRPEPQEFDHYLVIEDADDFNSELRTLVRERSLRGTEGQS